MILLDELSVYLRKVHATGGARGQLTSFLTSLLTAVEGAPSAALVYTLAIGKDHRATDAYSEENQYIADNMAELEKASARKATLLNPTEEDETVQVLRRRLFESIDEDRVSQIVDAYKQRWEGNKASLPPVATRPATVDQFVAGYPFHPEVLETLTSKTATLENFQRVRGMLRLLAKTVAHLWKTRPKDACAIHLHHIDPGHEPIRQEIVTRLGQGAYQPAITNDVSSASSDKRSFAQQIDTEFHRGLPPYAEYTARTIFLHSLAFNDPLKGLPPEQLRYSMVGPGIDISFVEDARKKFVAESAYLDDRPGAPMRFQVDANLSQIIRREERNVDPGEARAQLKDRIREVFGGKVFDAIHFPGGPFDVPDEVGGGRPKLAVLAYDGATIGASLDEVPILVQRIHKKKGSQGTAIRALQNNVVFVVADEVHREKMKSAICRVLALRELTRADRIVDLAEYQRDKVRELAASSEQNLAVAIQTCHRHVFYPSSQPGTVFHEPPASRVRWRTDGPSIATRPLPTGPRCRPGRFQVVPKTGVFATSRSSCSACRKTIADSPRDYVRRPCTPPEDQGKRSTHWLAPELSEGSVQGRNPMLPIMVPVRPMSSSGGHREAGVSESGEVRVPKCGARVLYGACRDPAADMPYRRAVVRHDNDARQEQGHDLVAGRKCEKQADLVAREPPPPPPPPPPDLLAPVAAPIRGATSTTGPKPRSASARPIWSSARAKACSEV